MKIAIFLILVLFLCEKAFGGPPLMFTGNDQKKPGLGINLGPIDSNMVQWVFTNKFKHAKEWRPVSSNNYWSTYGWAGQFSTNWSSDGWPLNFTHNPYGTTFIGYQTEIGTYGSYPSGNYVVTFQGTGNISLLGDATNVRIINSNKFEFTVVKPSKNGIVLIISKPNVTNIDLREKFEEFSNDTFGKNFTDAIKNFEALRFSAWMVNRNIGNYISTADQEWATRRTATFYTQHGQQMVSIEYIVELANFLNKDIWLSIPSAASSDYIVKIAQYVKDNLKNKTSLIYVEQSSDKGWNGNNRNLNMNLIKNWKIVFGNDTRVKYVLATWLDAYYENTVGMHSDDDLKQFHAYSVAGQISYYIPTNFDGYDVTTSANLSVNDIVEMIKQQIYQDERNMIYSMQKLKVKLNLPVIGYDVGFNVHAPGYSNRWKQTNYSSLEQRLEDLIIEALRQPIIEDVYLDFMERWYRSGGGIMFVSNIVDYVNRCEKGGGKCGYKSVLENLTQMPQNVPKYRALVKWLNGERGKIPFTSDDLPQVDPIPCYNCTWGTCYIGKCVCFDGYTGSNCDKLDKKYLDCASKSTEYGVNVNGIPDWSNELTFIDLQRRARTWIVHKMVFANAWADWNQTDIQLREDGYPKYLEIGKTVGTFTTRDLNAHYPNGDYVCLFDGDGYLDFAFLDVQITKRSAGRIEMKIVHKTEMNNGIYYNILRTNPSNPVRNIRILEARYEKIYKEFPFQPAFLEFLKKFKTIRFMPWSNINVDVDVDWINRTTDFYYTFNLKTGVSLEKQVLLCNTLGANPWFNLPHRATDLYITNWAKYVRDNLRPDVRIYIEVGNECWGYGGAHECGNYAQRMGYALNMTVKTNKNLYGLDLQGRICYHAKTGKRYLDIIKQVFGTGYNKNRINLVFSAQAAWTGPLEIFYLCDGNFYESYDVVAIAPYMSASMKNSDNNVLLVDEFYNSNVYVGIQSSTQQLKNTAALVNRSAPFMRLALYEAGPDFSSLTETWNTKLTELSLQIHRDPRIYQALLYYLGNMTKTNGVKLDVYMHYSSVGVYSKYGCWGLKESSDSSIDDSPKFRAYMNYIDSEKTCDWNEKENACINNCTFKGVCSPNLSTSKKEFCSCNFGSAGDYCQNMNYIKSEKCTYQCGGKGTCSYNHTEGYYQIYTCHCNSGYYGYGCDLFDCTNECNYNGRCVNNDTCSCFRGFKGKYCDIDCGCNGRGTCSNVTNQCVCDQGYSLYQGKCELDCCNIAVSTDCFSCPNCVYGTCYNGSCICWAGFTLDNNGSCTVKTTAKNDGSKLGINVNGVVDWSPQWAFLDLGKQARNWILQHIDKLNDLYLWSLNDPFNLTQERYPAAIPYQKQLVTIMLRDVRQKWPNGVYHVFFDGEGTLDFGFDAKILEYTEKNRMKISVSLTLVRDNGVFMKIKKSNPKNPIRNIRIVLDGYQNIYDKIPFHPLFLERLAMFKTIRFMPWTEEEGIVKWSDRITPSTYSQGKGVAYEHQVQLCNLLKANPWFTIPYAADDIFVTEMAKLVLNSLRKDVTIYVEYTNEAWNDFFNSGKYCINMGIKLGLSNDTVVARNLYYSKRSQEIIKIWQNVFQSEQNRIVLVLGSFYAMPTMTTRILDYNKAYLSHSKIMLAITGYISCGSPSAAYVVQSDFSVLFAGCDSDLNNTKNQIDKHYKIAKSYNVSLGMYESGTGMMELSVILKGSETPGATQKYIDMNRDIRMYKVYKDYYKMFNTFNLTENCHYGYVDIPSKYGTWELLEYQYQSITEAHRYRAMIELINETRTNY